MRKHWLRFATVFLPVLLAVLIGVLLLNAAANRRAVRALAIQQWTEKSNGLIAELRYETKNFEWNHPAYSIARRHLDRAPDGVDTGDLRFALDCARSEREIEADQRASGSK